MNLRIRYENIYLIVFTSFFQTKTQQTHNVTNHPWNIHPPITKDHYIQAFHSRI